ncbi:MAG TPA: efflux RND transporter periplasmic adaptor subunit [Bacteroidota bacterium]|nr:efflux RND transporter periplasmic adaptor subunit [Bacteroidota bacterium]
MSDTSHTTVRLPFLAGVLIILLFPACQSHEDGSETRPEAHRAVVTANGTDISIPAGTPGLAHFTTHTALRRRALISAIAPAHVVANISASVDGGDRIILFESSDVTTLYSSYRQARVNADRMAKNLQRIKDMFANQGATATDLTNAETDAATSRASVAEMEGRLRALGFNPLELDEVTANSAWLICDVPETQLNEVQRGEEVDVWFTSLPGKKFIGRATAVGDIVDPVTRTVKVRVTMPNPNGHILPGMFARVDFGDPRDGLLLIPNSAVVSVEGRDYIFLEPTPGEFRRREVIVQPANDTELVVLKGIEAGEQVVTGGAMLLKGLSFGF